MGLIPSCLSVIFWGVLFGTFAGWKKGLCFLFWRRRIDRFMWDRWEDCWVGLGWSAFGIASLAWRLGALSVSSLHQEEDHVVFGSLSVLQNTTTEEYCKQYIPYPCSSYDHPRCLTVVNRLALCWSLPIKDVCRFRRGADEPWLAG